MIAGLKPYAEYKESGLPWLGKVPGHWNLPRLGSVLQERRETNEQKQVTQVLSVLKDIGVIRYEDKGNIGNKKSEDIGRYKIVQPDDIVVNCMNVIIGSVGLSRHFGCLSPVYYVLTRRFEADNPRYLAAIFSTKPFQLSLVRIGNGILAHRMRIPMELLKCEPFPVPPPEEQITIVRFLDWANGRLERAIRAKRKVIALLNEQKQAIIHRAVTRGLDPPVPLKSSSIPWLDKSPAHWKWIPIKRLLSRMDYGTSEVSIETGSIRVLTMGNIQKGEVIMPRSGGLNNVHASLFLEHHDLLFTRTNGNPELVGKVGIFRGQLSDKVSFASYLVRLRVKEPHEPQWLHMLLNSSAFWPFARSHALVNLQTNLNSTRYGNFPVPVPPPSEQMRIVEFVKEESMALNTTVSRLEREIDLLREYRTRLVADVVSGKLDVREAARHLPKEEAAPEDTIDNVMEATNDEEDVS